MLPVFLSTVTMPSATIHLAGALRSCAETHSSRFLPSKRMIASDGAAVQVVPGVTTLGSGVQTSVSSGLAVGCWAKTAVDRAIRKAAVRAWVRMARYSIHPAEGWSMNLPWTIKCLGDRFASLGRVPHLPTPGKHGAP